MSRRVSLQQSASNVSDNGTAVAEGWELIPTFSYEKYDPGRGSTGTPSNYDPALPSADGYNMSNFSNSDTQMMKHSYSVEDMVRGKEAARASSTGLPRKPSFTQRLKGKLQSSSAYLKSKSMDIRTKLSPKLQSGMDILKAKASLVKDSLSAVMDDTRSKGNSRLGGITEKRRAICPAPEYQIPSICQPPPEPQTRSFSVGKDPPMFKAIDLDQTANNKPNSPRLGLASELNRPPRSSCRSVVPVLPTPDSVDPLEALIAAMNDAVRRDSVTPPPRQSVSLSPSTPVPPASPQLPPPDSVTSLSSPSRKPEPETDCSIYTEHTEASIDGSGKRRPRKKRGGGKLTKLCGHLASCTCAQDKYASDLEEMAAAQPPVEVPDANPYKSLFTPDMQGLMTPMHLYELACLYRMSGLTSQYFFITNIPFADTFKVAKMSVHSAKNRYSDVLAFDGTRVVLTPVRGVPTTDFINASFVNGYNQAKGYIACQGPMGKTRVDFWRMIWQENVRVIVMTTKVTEKGRSKCHQYWPLVVNTANDHEFYMVTNVNVEGNEEYIISKLHVLNKQTEEVREVYHIIFQLWPDYGVPSSSEDFLNFLFVARDLQQKCVESMGSSWKGHPRGPPMVVHCSAGVGRSGTFICADICIYMMDDINQVNIQGVVKGIRTQRAYAVQTAEQYLFAHYVILEYSQKRGLIPADVDLRKLLKE